MCSSCKERVSAHAFTQINTVAAFAMMTVQRFRYDNLGQSSKDVSAVEFPLALDLTFIGECHYGLCGRENAKELAVLFQALLMPWKSFLVR